MDTTAIIEWGGLIIIVFLVFSETGLLLGLAIPGGESLVFTAGLLAGTSILNASLAVLLPALIIAAFAGDICGYYIGKRLGPRLYNKEDTWYYRKKYIYMAEDFVHKHKRRALMLGKFLPVIRPFTPLISGISEVKRPRFIGISAIACTVYITAFTLAGFFLGRQMPWLNDYIFWILPISIVIAITVVVIQYRNYEKGPKQRED